MRINVTSRGPLFSGQDARLMDQYASEVEQKLAQHMENRIHQVLGVVLKHPTGYYESRIQTERAGDEWIVNDSDVVYGPWLEGVGSRNQTTRFKGYATFRKVTEEVESDVDAIAQAILEPYLRRMQ